MSFNNGLSNKYEHIPNKKKLTHSSPNILVLIHKGGGGGSGGAMVLGKLPVPGRPTIWITVGQGPTAIGSRCRWGLFGHFYSHLSFLFFFSLSLGDGPV